jgi:hypothetical protein
MDRCSRSVIPPAAERVVVALFAAAMTSRRTR